MSPESSSKPSRRRLESQGLALFAGITMAAALGNAPTAAAATHHRHTSRHARVAVPAPAGIDGGTPSSSETTGATGGAGPAPETTGQGATAATPENITPTGGTGPAPQGSEEAGGAQAPVTPGAQGGVQAPA